MAEQFSLPHGLSLDSRKTLKITGVTEVMSFDEQAVVLKTSMGKLTVQGANLKLKTLSLEGGQVEVNGHISVLAYEEPRPEGSFWGRLFR